VNCYLAFSARYVEVMHIFASRGQTTVFILKILGPILQNLVVRATRRRDAYTPGLLWLCNSYVGFVVIVRFEM
jgi:hypothetical protein